MIKIYTDGAYAPSRDKGGLAIVVLKDDEFYESYSEGHEHTTNNRMELLAAILALEKYGNLDEIELNSDSLYVVKHMDGSGWKRNNNHDLWERMDKAVENKQIIWKWVKGHDHNEYNEMCDKLAVEKTL